MSESSDFNILKHTVGEVFDVNGDGSVMKEVLVAGEGEENPCDGAEVCVSYVGRLHENKKEFDSNEEFSFTAGSGVIEGWSDVIKSMVVGEKSRVVIKSEKGYGETGAGDIPPNATLEFDIELKRFTSEKDVNGDGSLTFKVLKSNPANWERPDDLSEVKLAISIKLLDNPEEVLARYTNESPLTIIIDGDAEINASLPPAVEQLAKQMTLESIVTAQAVPALGFPAGEHVGKALRIDAKLVELKRAPSFWELDMDGKVAEGDRLKTLGNAAFKKGDYARAVRRYNSATSGLEYIASDSKNSLADKKRASDIVSACRLNIAQVSIKEGDFSNAWTQAKKVTESDSINPKAWFRLGVALSGLGEVEQAESALKRALEFAPGDAGIISELNKVKAVIRKQNAAEKKRFAGMFRKLSGFASDDRPVAAAKEEDDFDMGDDFGDMPELDEHLADKEFAAPDQPDQEHTHEGGCCDGH